jgi:lysophospholipase L1-like esterase
MSNVTRRLPWNTDWFAGLVLGMVALGTSCAQGMVVVALGDSTTARRANVPKVYAQILQDKLPALLGASATVYNAGIPGNKTNDALARLDADVRKRHPDVVIVQFGINDSWVYHGGQHGASDMPIDAAAQVGHPNAARGNFADNLTKIVATLKRDRARVILMTPNQLQTTGPGAEQPWQNDLLEKYAQVVRQVAAAQGVGLVDAWQMYADYAASPGHSVKELLCDSQHPNQAGHQMEAEALLELIASEASPHTAGKTRIVFVSGEPSHNYAEHEHYSDCLLAAHWLRAAFPNVETAVCRYGWPKDPKVVDGAAAIVVFSDGGDKKSLILPHLDQIDKLMKQGVGLACFHYALTIPKGRPGDLMKDWLGGYYETFWSIHPFWTANFKRFPEHPITRGVKPLSLRDEWFYHMRFIDGMEGVTPILTDVPPDRTRNGPDSPHDGNPTVRAERGRAEHVAWARVRPDGGRGFGFTGCHSHWNWANDSFRTLVLNGIAWVAKLDIPPNGVPSQRPTFEQLEANQDEPQPKGFDPEAVRKMIEQWK